MTRLLGIVFFGLLLLSSMQGQAELEPARPLQDTFISRIVFVDSKLWLLTDAGLMSTVTPEASALSDVALPEPAIDLWAHGGKATVVTGARSKAKSWTVRQWDGGAWKAVARLRRTTRC